MTKSSNLFDPIRHLAALTVLYSHHFALSGLTEPTVPRWDTYGFVAVAVFFAISGFLMPMSFRTSDNFLDFMARRCRRIFPGLIVCCFLMIYVLGAALTPDSLVHYLFGKSQLSNFVSFATFGGRPIDGVFSDAIVKYAINGSLWTLPVEFAWYAIIGYALSISQSWKTPAALLWLSGTAVLINLSLKYDYSFFNVPFSYLGLFRRDFLDRRTTLGHPRHMAALPSLPRSNRRDCPPYRSRKARLPGLRHSEHRDPDGDSGDLVQGPPDPRPLRLLLRDVHLCLPNPAARYQSSDGQFLVRHGAVHRTHPDRRRGLVLPGRTTLFTPPHGNARGRTAGTGC
jgi:hypothetical protein